MKKVKDWKLVTVLFALMGLDTGAHVNEEAVVPKEWESWFDTAEAEAFKLDSKEVEDLTQGAEEDQVKAKEKAPYAFRLLDCAFDDGPLSGLVFSPWETAVELRTAEARYRELARKLTAKENGK